MANRTKLLLAVALAAAWPCAAEQKSIAPSMERVWELASDGIRARAPGLEALVALPGWQWVGERYSCPPVVAVGPRGEALVTSNVVPTLWKIDPDTLSVSLHELELDSDQEKDVGFSSLRFSPEDGAWIAFSSAHGSTWRIDPTLTRATKVVQNAEGSITCATH